MTAHQFYPSGKVVFGGKMHDQWSRPIWGLYQLTFAGHELEVVKSPPRPGPRQKLYTVKIDGVIVAKAWQAGDARSRAISLVKRMLKGKPLVPLVEDDVSEPPPWSPEDIDPRNDDKAIMLGQQKDHPKIHVHQEWDHPETGIYTLRYEGHDLEIRKGPVFKPNGYGNDKSHLILVDGVVIARAWSPSQGKLRAIKMVDRAHGKGKPLVPLAEVEADAEVKVEVKPGDLPFIPDDRDGVLAHIAMTLREAEKNDALLREAMLSEALERKALNRVPDWCLDHLSEQTPPLPDDRDEALLNATEALETMRKALEQRPEPSKETHPTFSFTITGKVDLTLLATLTTTIELLRQGGHVTGEVLLPPRITL